jgi:hypothetical protein
VEAGAGKIPGVRHEETAQQRVSLRFGGQRGWQDEEMLVLETLPSMALNPHIIGSCRFFKTLSIAIPALAL